MTTHEFACIAIGVLFNVLTFALGVAAGINLAKRKGNRHGYENEGFRYYGDHATPDAARGVGGGFKGGGRGQITEASAAKRAYW